MGSATDGTRSAERSDLGRLWWARPLTVLAALAANLAVRGVALAVFPISPEFHNLMWGHLAWVTVAAVGTAVLGFAVVGRYAARPIRLYRRIAAGVLVASFVPDVALYASDEPGSSGAAIAALMVMHVVDAALCMWLLPALTSVRARSEDSAAAAGARLAGLPRVNRR